MDELNAATLSSWISQLIPESPVLPNMTNFVYEIGLNHEREHAAKASDLNVLQAKKGVIELVPRKHN